MRPSPRRPALSFRPHLLAASLVMLAAPVVAHNAAAQGTPRSMAECERLKNDLAYNQCLAMFGPPARNVASGGGYVSGSGSDAASSTSSVASTATIPGIPSIEEPDVEPVRRRGRRSGRRGRAVASFDVGSADAGAAESEGGSTRSRRSRR
ncbi:hypothetical protein [Methylobacterium sp. R2-1]|uniref:hypothetical protein n=1 Tax=Methylobacterium sp. R2-1 TaxID=2587064 RepID=UPI00160B0B69|nr:hypothetical protein [Methylobacterium sp. R2-1]MBB2960359.1 hypothetical protein [Methylobacterium sp. R2-1]